MAYSSSRSPIEIKARILTLPPELIEQILILAALYGFPSAIAQFGCTCSYFHQLVYRSTDNHLWREVFLTTFDDPRLVLGRINSATTFSPGKMSRRGHGDNFRTGEVVFNWGREFIRRIDAMRIMKKYKDLGEEWNNIETNSSHAEVSVLSVISMRMILMFHSESISSVQSAQVSSLGAGDCTSISCPKKSGCG